VAVEPYQEVVAELVHKAVVVVEVAQELVQQELRSELAILVVLLQIHSKQPTSVYTINHETLMCTYCAIYTNVYVKICLR